MLILNVAAGNQPVLDLDKIVGNKQYTVINVDKGYMSGNTPNEIERVIRNQNNISSELFCQYDVWKFLERTLLKFDYIAVYRFLEHVPYTSVSYFIYLLYRVSNPGAIVDVVVPDYEKLAKMILEEDVGSASFERHNILLTTELLNEPFSPHASIWTKSRLKKFFTLENYFRISAIDNFCMDRRDIYIRALFESLKERNLL